MEARVWFTRLLRWARLLLAGLGLLVLVVTFSPLVSWWGGKLGEPWLDSTGDVLIVLAGSNLGDGIIGMSSYWRCVYAILVYRQGNFREVVVSGAADAAAMRTFLIAQGLPAEVIRIEDASANTHESALNTKKLLAAASGRKVLLTSDYHMYRAYRAFTKAGLEVAPRPFPDVRKRAARWIGRWPAFLDLMVETVKIGYYFARGWI